MRFLNRSAGRLSRHRRRPVAGLLLLMLGLVLTGSLYAAFAPSSTADSAKSDEELVDEGRKLFLVSCSTCHGQNGEGIATQDGNQLGPSLVGVGAAAANFQLTTGRMPAVQPGAQNPTKPVTFDDDEIAALAAYVASLGPGPAIPDPSDYSLAGLSRGGARGGGLPRWPDLPDQLHRLPQLRRQGRCDAARGLRARPEQHRGPADLRGDADRPRPDGQLLQRQPVAGGEARRHRLPLLAA